MGIIVFFGMYYLRGILIQSLFYFLKSIHIMLLQQNNGADTEEQHFLDSIENFQHGYHEPRHLRRKLEEILRSLQSEIEHNQNKYNSCVEELQKKVREKDEIITCLIKINGNLINQNQKLKKKQSKSIENYKHRLECIRKDFACQKQEMISVIRYLQSRNEVLIRKIGKNESLLQSQSYPSATQFIRQSWITQVDEEKHQMEKLPSMKEYTRSSSLRLVNKSQEGNKIEAENRKSVKHLSPDLKMDSLQVDPENLKKSISTEFLLKKHDKSRCF